MPIDSMSKVTPPNTPQTSCKRQALSRRLRRDQRGAITVVTLFASSLLIGLLFYVFGVGQAIHHRELFQDAADAAAFSSAAVHARGMNLIALLNLVILSVTAVSMSLLAAIAGAAGTVQWIYERQFHFPVIPILWTLAIDATATWSERIPVYDQIHAAANQAQATIAGQISGYARLRAADRARMFEGVTSAFNAPQTRLPVVGEPLSSFCGRVPALVRPVISQAYAEFRATPPYAEASRVANDMVGSMCIERGKSSMALSNSAHPGGEAFQLRLFVVGEQLRRNEEIGARVATWMRDEDGGQVARLRAGLSRIGFAQGEYYPSGPTRPQQAQLWHLDWKARLRRFRTSDDFAAFATECGRVGEDIPCTDVANALQELANDIIH